MSDGYRMEREARERDERLAEYGKSRCFYCGEAMPEGPKAMEKSDWDRHMHIGLHVSGGKPVVLMPEEIGFCSTQCKDWWGQVCKALETVRTTMENATSPAVKVSLTRSLLKEALAETRKHV